jgi:hypothetical protein
LKETGQKGNIRRLEYCCPIIEHENIQHQTEESIVINIKICPYKLAATNEYNRIRIDDALTLLKTKGRSLSTECLSYIKSKAYRLCSENHYEKLLDAAEARQELHSHTPCRCCGSTTHSLLKYNTSFNNTVSIEYAS